MLVGASVVATPENAAKLDIREVKNKPKVFYASDGFKLKVGRGRFFRIAFSEPGTEKHYRSEAYIAGLAAKKLLEGASEGRQKGLVEKLENAGVLDGELAGGLLVEARGLTNETKGMLWDRVRSPELQKKVFQNAALPLEKVSEYIGKDVNAFLGWYAPGVLEPNGSGIAQALAGIANSDGGLAMIDAGNLPKLLKIVCREGKHLEGDTLTAIFVKIKGLPGFKEKRQGLLLEMEGEIAIRRKALNAFYDQYRLEDVSALLDAFLDTPGAYGTEMETAIARKIREGIQLAGDPSPTLTGNYVIRMLGTFEKGDWLKEGVIDVAGIGIPVGDDLCDAAKLDILLAYGNLKANVASGRYGR